MGDSNFGAIELTAVGVLFIAIVLSIVGLAVPYWCDAETGYFLFQPAYGFNYGLWEVCIQHHAIPSVISHLCWSYSDDNFPGRFGGKEKAVQAFAVLSVIVAIISFLSAVSRFSGSQAAKTVYLGILAFLAAVLGLLAIIIFLGTDSFNTVSKREWLGFGFYLFLAGMLIIMIDSFVLCYEAPETHRRNHWIA